MDEHQRILEIAGWQVKVITYCVDGEWHAKADNVSPEAALARTRGATREEAEAEALKRAEQLLSRNRRAQV